MLGIVWRDRNRSSRIVGQTEREDILMTVRRKKLTWTGPAVFRTDGEAEMEGETRVDRHQW